METKTQEIVEPHEIRTILMRNFYGTDIDKDFDSKGFCDELAEYMSKWVTEDRANQEYNARLAFKKILDFIGNRPAVYLTINEIIKSTFGELK